MATAVAIDLNTLDDLFNNQKRIDDLFNSAFDFDDDLLFDSSTVVSNDEPASSADSWSSYDEHWSGDDEKSENKYRIVYLVMPVLLEIAVLYYGLTYFM